MKNGIILNEGNIRDHIHFVRGQNVMFDFDLAALYGVETRILKQTVKRNLKRFPDDFMFELSPKEINEMVSQNVIPSKSYLGGAVPFAFTEQGVAMLSGVLKSERAIEVNIAIMRTFVQYKKWILAHQELVKKIDTLESRYDEQFKLVFTALKELIREEAKPRKRIGFRNY